MNQRLLQTKWLVSSLVKKLMNQQLNLVVMIQYILTLKLVKKMVKVFIGIKPYQIKIGLSFYIKLNIEVMYLIQ